MSNLIFGFIAGHGGMVNGKYATAPHKMFTLPDGREIYEGVINREIVKLTLQLAKWESLGAQCINIVEEETDVPLAERVERVKRLFNSFRLQGKELVLFEVHCNASTTHQAEGFESFSTEKENFSDLMSKIWIEEMVRVFPRARNRGDKDKDFFVIFRSPCFGILNEHFFFDNPKEIAANYTAEGMKNHALAYIRTMHKLNALRRNQSNTPPPKAA